MFTQRKTLLCSIAIQSLLLACVLFSLTILCVFLNDAYDIYFRGDENLPALTNVVRLFFPKRANGIIYLYIYTAVSISHFFVGYLLITNQKEASILRYLLFSSISYTCIISLFLIGLFFLILPFIPDSLRLSPMPTSSQLRTDKLLMVSTTAYMILLALVIFIIEKKRK